MARIASLVVTCLALASHVSAADPGSDAPEQRSPNKAVALSAVPTAMSAAAIAAGFASNDDGQQTALVLGGTLGLVISPSIGHWYGTGSPGTVGLAVRAAGVGSMTCGLGLIAMAGIENLFHGEAERPTAGYVLLFGGMAAVAGGVVYDLATVHGRTRRANERRAASHFITPLVIPTRTQPTVGLGVVGTF